MKTQEAIKKKEETLKLLKKEKEDIKEIEQFVSERKKTVSELERSLYKESSRLEEKIERLGQKIDHGWLNKYNIVRIGPTAYSFDHHGKFQHGLRKNKYNEFDLYDVVDKIIPPSKNKSHLGFNVGHQIRIKQEVPVPFRYVQSSSSFYFPAGVDIVERDSHYILGKTRTKKIKNPIVRTTIKCFYEDGKALVEYYHSREGTGNHYFDVVDLSNYEICSHLECDSEKCIDKSFAEYLETSGLTEKIEFKDKFGFRAGESIYVKSHEIILDNPANYGIYGEVLEHVLGKDLYFMHSFRVASKCIESAHWKVFGFVGDKVLVECNTIRGFRHFELFSPEEIGLIIDLDYRLKKENYFDRLIYRENRYGSSPILEGIKKIK